MKFGILGPIEAWDDARPLRIGGPREHKVLATLLLNVGRSVPVPRLAAAIWGDDQPATAKAQVHNSIAALRRNLVTAAGEQVPIARSGAGFLIVVADDQLDAAQFAHQVEEAEKLVAAHRLADAAQLLRQALKLWRGPALDGADSGLLAVEARRLDERRLAGIERSIALDLELGRHAEVAGELAALTAEHPLREGLVELRMLALYRSGRRSDALELYATTRRRLAAETGLDPRTALDRLHQAILRGDRSLDLDSVPVPVAPSVVPAQLPTDVAGFAGRRDEHALLDLLITEREAGQRPHAIAAIVGPGGMGKTALAIRWGYRRMDAFPDGQLYVDLHGYGHDAPLTPLVALGRLLRGLGALDEEIAADLDERAAQYRSLLADRRILIVLDNAASSDQVRPLLPGAGPQTVLITSRDRLDGLVIREGARQLVLGPLPEDDAAAVVRAAVPRSEGDDEAIAALVRLCDRMPLALRIAAARLTAQTGQTVADLVDELTDEQDRLSGLSLASGDAAVRTAFASSYQTLSPDAALLLRRIGLHQGPEPSAAACAATAGLPPAQTAPLLEELVSRHMVVQVAPRRYGQHDLIRLYARELAHAQDSGAERSNAQERALMWYLRTADAGDRLLRPHRNIPFTVPPDSSGHGPAYGHGPGYGYGYGRGPTFADAAEVLAWFDLEAPNLTLAIAAAERTHPELCWRLATVMYAWLERRRRRSDWLELFSIGTRAAIAVDDLPATAMMRQSMAIGLCYLERNAEAIAVFEDVVATRRRIGDPRTLASSLMNLGNQYAQTGRDAEAVAHLTEALALFESMPEGSTWVGTACNNVGWAHYMAARYDEAAEYYMRAGAIARENDNAQSLSFAEGNLALVREKQDRPFEALELWRIALQAAQTAGDRELEANSWYGLGRSHLALGDLAGAHDTLIRALPIYEELEDQTANEVRALLAQHPAPAATP
jgi:DNA-binding SARP family transcriptional activator